MTAPVKGSVRLKVSPEVARIVREAPREEQVAAARGALPLSGEDLLTTLFFLAHGKDAELRFLALETLGKLPAEALASVLRSPSTPPQLLDLLAQLRLEEPPVMELVLNHPAVSVETVVRVAGRAEGSVLSLVIADTRRLKGFPEIAEAIALNPRADREIRVRFGWRELPPDPAPEEPSEENDGSDDGNEEGEELNLSKYKMALQLEVPEKIKLALTGDKEWRAIFLKDTNKLVSSAVLKNPRITEGEVLAVAKNRSAHDELIRLITLNPEWIKNYEIQKALVYHPRTPLPKALRYMNTLTPRDLKHLAKSRGISQVLVNNARRIMLAKEKNR